MKAFLFISLLLSQPLIANDKLGLPPLNIPQNNPQTAEKIALGKLLFNDKSLSADGTINCASCHQIDKAFTDGLTTSIGINQQTGTRNAPTVVNAAFYKSLFLDGREADLEGQALGPFINPIEHGLADAKAVTEKVRTNRQYLPLFKQVFGVDKKQLSITHITQAIASYERTLIAGNSPFDRYFFKNEKTALSKSAARGSRLFRRKGNCANCHEISWNNALFTDNNFYNIGVGFQRINPQIENYIAQLQGEKNSINFTLQQQSELGRFAVTSVIKDLGKFKTPTLRNIALTAPYMHDGSLKTLAEVVEYYNKGGIKNRFLDPAIFPLKFTKQEKQDLVEFLKSLTSNSLSFD